MDTLSAGSELHLSRFEFGVVLSLGLVTRTVGEIPNRVRCMQKELFWFY